MIAPRNSYERMKAIRPEEGVVYVLFILVNCNIFFWNKAVHFEDNRWPSAGEMHCSNGEFVIPHFTDLHFGESDKQDRRSRDVMASVLNAEKQTDLVVFGGDQVSGWLVWNSNQALTKWEESLRETAGRNLQFATIFGNHDDQPYQSDPRGVYPWVRNFFFVACVILCVSLYRFGLTKRTWYAFLLVITLFWYVDVLYPSTTTRRSIFNYEKAMHASQSRTQAGDPALQGQSNYYIPVTCLNRTALVFFLDSGGGRFPQALMKEQSDWVQAVSTTYPGSYSIIFVHIAPVEYETARINPLFKCWGDDVTEEVTPVENGNAFDMQSLFNAGLRAVFVGHDHRNSWCCVSRTQPALCYGRHTGYGGYGTWERGSRIIRMSFADSFVVDTWLRMENGSKIEHGDLFRVKY